MTDHRTEGPEDRLDRLFVVLDEAGRTDDTDASLDPDDQRLAERVAPWFATLRREAQHAATDDQVLQDEVFDEPVAHDDPVALMLGLVPDDDSVVDGRKLANARRAAGLDLRQLVARLTARGWSVRLSEALRWETGQVALAPALIAALASELGIVEDDLVVASRSEHDLADLFDDARIREFLADWSLTSGFSPQELQRRSIAELTAAAHRNRTAGSVDALLAVLQTLRAIPRLLGEP